MPRSAKPGERLFAAVLIVFSAAALWQAYEIAGFSKLSSPGVFPMLAALIMLVSAFVVWLDQRPASNESTSTSAPDAEPDFTLVPPRVLVVSLLLVAYVLAMPTLGFLIDSGLFLFTCIGYLWNRPLWMSLLVSAVSLLAIYLVFRLLFQVILPQGTLIGVLT